MATAACNRRKPEYVRSQSRLNAFPRRLEQDCLTIAKVPAWSLPDRAFPTCPGLIGQDPSRLMLRWSQRRGKNQCLVAAHPRTQTLMRALLCGQLHHHHRTLEGDLSADMTRREASSQSKPAHLCKFLYVVLAVSVPAMSATLVMQNFAQHSSTADESISFSDTTNTDEQHPVLADAHQDQLHSSRNDPNSPLGQLAARWLSRKRLACMKNVPHKQTMLQLGYTRDSRRNRLSGCSSGRQLCWAGGRDAPASRKLAATPQYSSIMCALTCLSTLRDLGQPVQKTHACKLRVIAQWNRKGSLLYLLTCRQTRTGATSLQRWVSAVCRDREEMRTKFSIRSRSHRSYLLISVRVDWMLFGALVELLESDVVRVLPEALATHVQLVLPDESVSVGAGSAEKVRRSDLGNRFESLKLRLSEHLMRH